MLDEGQLERLRRIWATDRCPRKQYKRVMGERELPQRYDSFKGSFEHRVIEASLSGEPFDPEVMLREFPQQHDEVMNEAEAKLRKLNTWIESSGLDLKGAEYEKKFELELPLGYVLIRKIDILTGKYSLDWKGGIKRNTLDYRIDLALNDKVLKEAGYSGREHGLVFLGGEEVEALFPFSPDKKGKATPFAEAQAEAEKTIEQNIFWREQIKAGKIPPCEVDYACVSCPFRGDCRGI